MSELNICYLRKYRSPKSPVRTLGIDLICFSCKTTSGTLASNSVLRVRPRLGHRHRI
ncbi:hypothetical protein F383_25928 [Gossypium arboreum]|uniref:Uncharacterized protein n=1 Tax=Gossypium arboreum TaxID=29729 RepID=A0A0B0P810_GOSAR|nr:hypothetical protein F383_25928 [Gossypium arboreum]